MLQYFIEYFLHTNKKNITNNLKKNKSNIEIFENSLLIKKLLQLHHGFYI